MHDRRAAPIGSSVRVTATYSAIVTRFGSTSVRPLAVADVDDYLHHVREVDAGSGVDGAGHSHAYSQSEPFDVEAGRAREVTRWSTEIDDLAWRRAWGLFDQGELVGHLHLAGGMLHSELHRVDVGMGIERSHRRQGGGTMLLETGIEWARNQSTIDWIDLGVFSDNPGAQALYARHGFQIVGRKPDRFRVDGESLDNISMTLKVTRENE
jgi:RimJ/RimL family protein N-acetyltransferase